MTIPPIAGFPVPERVPVYPFHRPYGALVVDGLKDETRPAAWPREPGWLAVYNCARTAKLQPEARVLPAARPYVDARSPSFEADIGQPGAVIGLAWVAGSRLLERTDLPRSFYWEPGRFLWLVRYAVRFGRPLSLAELGLRTAPQSFVYAPGKLLAARARGEV